MVEGKLTLTACGTAQLVLGPQESAVIGCGTALRVQAGSLMRFSFCAAACAKPTKRGLVQLRADADFKPSASLPPEALLGPAPQCRSDNFSAMRARSTARAPGIRPRPPDRSPASPERVHASAGRECAVRRARKGARSRRAPAMRFSCPRAHRWGGKAAIAWRNSSWFKASRPETIERDPSCPLR